MLGMREGETAQLQRELDYVNGLKGSLEGRQAGSIKALLSIY
jgi:hypothetical protein